MIAEIKLTDVLSINLGMNKGTVHDRAGISP